MCGIVGIVSQSPVNQSIYDALTVLQHRGQDAAGIVTIDDENRFRLRKANGLVSDVFQHEHMLRLAGNTGIGHVRYPTAGSSSVSEAQPFYVNSPYGLTLVHNGNLTNSTELKEKLFNLARRHVNTNSDSELLLNILAYHFDQPQKYVFRTAGYFQRRQINPSRYSRGLCLYRDDYRSWHGGISRSSWYSSVSVGQT